MSRNNEDTFLVTTVAQSPVEERHGRERRYLITMGIRVIAFVAAILLRHVWIGPIPAAAIAIVLALVLPWVAVIEANAPHRRGGGAPALYPGEDRQQLNG